MRRSTQIAYVAGLVDGDGTLNLAVIDYEDRVNPGFIPSIKIRMNAQAPVEKAAGVLGGNARWSEGENGWIWSQSYVKAVESCKRLRPFLIGKQKQVDLLIAFQNHVNRHISSRGHSNPSRGSHPHSDDVINERLAMCDQLVKLHTPDPNMVIIDDHTQSKSDLVAYAAGLIDAEGTITAISSGRGKTIAVMMQMTDPVPMQRLAQLFGGHVHPEKRLTVTGKKVFSWRIEAGRALSCCKLTRPYLRVKCKQADIAIRFQNNVDLWKVRGSRTGKGRIALPDRIRAKRLQWFNELRALNPGHHKRAGAETKSEHPLGGSDSPSCNNDKVAEHDRNDHAATDLA